MTPAETREKLKLVKHKWFQRLKYGF
jgi:hypothetical protein